MCFFHDEVQEKDSIFVAVSGLCLGREKGYEWICSSFSKVSLIESVAAMTNVVLRGEGKCTPKGRKSWTDTSGEVLPTIYRGILQKGFTGANLSRDFAVQFGFNRAAAQDFGD
jgi:hypothetical protein